MINWKFTFHMNNKNRSYLSYTATVNGINVYKESGDKTTLYFIENRKLYYKSEASLIKAVEKMIQTKND